MPSPYFNNYGVETLSSATIAITDDAHVGQRLVLHRAAGVTATLPAATGSGNRYEFIVRTTVTSNGYIIRVANATNIMVGHATIFQDGGDTQVSFETAADSDTITLNGTTTGGLAGARVILDDIASGLWAVEIRSAGTGIEATPFSATV